MKASKSMILKTIVAKCLDCCCGVKAEVKACTAVKCPLHNFRLGKADVTEDVITKKRKRTPMSDAQKAAMKAGREAKRAAKA